jgi:hypothetical protein
MSHLKPTHLRQRRNKRNEAGLVSREDGLDIPPGDRAWLRATSRAWAEYWASDVSGLIQRDSDMVAVKRLFDYRDEHSRALAAYRKERISQGSHGQLRVSPPGDMLVKLERLMIPLEDRYGLSSLSRMRLGAEVGATAKSLAEMNASLTDIAGGDDGDEDYVDTGAKVYDLPGLPAADQG